MGLRRFWNAPIVLASTLHPGGPSGYAAFASGMGAAGAILRLLPRPARIVASSVIDMGVRDALMQLERDGWRG